MRQSSSNKHIVLGLTQVVHQLTSSWISGQFHYCKPGRKRVTGEVQAQFGHCTYSLLWNWPQIQPEISCCLCFILVFPFVSVFFPQLSLHHYYHVSEVFFFHRWCSTIILSQSHYILPTTEALQLGTYSSSYGQLLSWSIWEARIFTPSCQPQFIPEKATLCT